MGDTAKKKYTIALVEDDEVMSKTLGEELEEEGFSVIKAFDGAEGLKMALAKQPDMVLLDIVMPKMDGMTMIKKLRASGDYGKAVPVILLTNLNADDKIMSGVVEDEPSYYLVKSKFSLADVVAKVKKHLAARG